MFGLFGKKKILKSGLLEGMTDIHCHLLPAVDDGAENKDEALQALRLMESIGVIVEFSSRRIVDFQWNACTGGNLLSDASFGVSRDFV